MAKKPEPPGADEIYGRVRKAVLPPKVKADYDRQIAACETAWRATDESVAVAEAITLSYLFRQVVPAWVETAAVSVIIDQRTAEQARRHRESMRHMFRYMYVHSFRQSGVPLREAAERAKEVLNGTGIANVTVDEIIESYKKVRRDIEAGRQAEYFFLKDPRYFNVDGTD